MESPSCEKLCRCLVALAFNSELTPEQNANFLRGYHRLQMATSKSAKLCPAIFVSQKNKTLRSV